RIHMTYRYRPLCLALALSLAVSLNTSIAFAQAFANTPPPSPVITGPAADGTSFTNYSTCQHAYVEGSYECVQFAQDFQKECTANGIKSWKWYYGPSINGLQAAFTDIGNCAGHVVSIVQFCNPNSVNLKFCVIDPGPPHE